MMSERNHPREQSKQNRRKRQYGKTTMPLKNNFKRAANINKLKKQQYQQATNMQTQYKI